MRIVEFNGLGEPNVDGIEDGQILIRFQHDCTEVVKLHLVPPEEYGPELLMASNWKVLEQQAYSEITRNHPECIDSDRHWVFECPEYISERAIFE